MVRISSTAGTDSERFYGLWEAMVALNAMCVRVGKKGTANQLGPSFCSFACLYLRLLQSLLIRFLSGRRGRLDLTVSNEPFGPQVVGAINITATERI